MPISKPGWLYVSRISYPRPIDILRVAEGIFYIYLFYTSVIGYRSAQFMKRAMHISEEVVGKFPQRNSWNLKECEMLSVCAVEKIPWKMSKWTNIYLKIIWVEIITIFNFNSDVKQMYFHHRWFTYNNNNFWWIINNLMYWVMQRIMSFMCKILPSRLGL